jgi:hypothetical protein
VTVIVVLRRACGDSFIAEAQVGIVMQQRGEITALGEQRRKDHAPGFFPCPPHADSVDTSNLGRSKQSEIHRNLKPGSNFKNMLNCFALVWEGSGLGADQKPEGQGRITLACWFGTIVFKHIRF